MVLKCDKRTNNNYFKNLDNKEFDFDIGIQHGIVFDTYTIEDRLNGKADVYDLDFTKMDSRFRNWILGYLELDKDYVDYIFCSVVQVGNNYALVISSTPELALKLEMTFLKTANDIELDEREKVERDLIIRIIPSSTDLQEFVKIKESFL